ncbi:MAG: patatin-like phospholipase family protein [Bacteroidetes bacterium]|nr:patatin-like phospholipase family protein [Bacteroidota bacterium]MDA1120249.1 patatin-like phospholipase family protein [Bacteroidota bacterium]
MGKIEDIKNKLFSWLEAIFFSFPIQLVIHHLKKNQVLIFCWVWLTLVVNQQFGKLLGIPYLFLDPEYLNHVDFRSFFIVGITLGGFTVAFHITCYILDGHKYNFLGILERPFAKFSVNNSVIPVVGILSYFLAVVNFQMENDASQNEIMARLAGLFLGIVFMITMLYGYFKFTNKDIFKFLTGSVDQVLKKVKMSRRARMTRFMEAQKGDYRVDNYFDLGFKLRSTQGLHDFYNKEAVLKVFDQNHFNSVIIEIFIIVLILVLGRFMDVAIFQIPAAASAILILTIIVMIFGLVSYWTRGWSLSVAILLFLILNGLWKAGALKRENEAYGLDYSGDKAIYSKSELLKFSSIERYGGDKLQTLDILENWKLKQRMIKPPVILVCVSGGGQRAALWTFNALQEIDSLLNGSLMDKTTLITGASGGMIGASYYRELYLRKRLGEDIDLGDLQYRKNIGADNLNPIVFSLLVNDIFLRRQLIEFEGMTYSKNRGYAFENQLNKNTGFILDKHLSDYKTAEQESVIPMTIMAPTIINDGRKLYISPQNVSYMTLANEAVDGSNDYKVTGVDFINFFNNQGAQNLRFLTALRMSATFPYITPNIRLPSEPQIEVMDAGIADNYGIADALRFLYVFRDWFSRNTSKVIFLSIRDTEKDPIIDATTNPSIIERIGAPLSSIYSNLGNIQDLNNDKNMEFAGTWFNGSLHLIEIEYNTGSIFEDKEFVTLNQELETKKTERASLSWHLTEKEKSNIVSRIHIPENQKAIFELKSLTEK